MSGLSSWSDGFAKLAIIDFVSRVTKEGGADYVPSAERIAVFDNDGTLWCEQPMPPQFFFGRDRLRALADKFPEIRNRQPFKAYLDHDVPRVHDLGKKGMIEVGAAAHAGMTEDEFADIAREWLAAAEHPQYGVPFTQCIYKPQIELLGYLRDNNFKTFIISGGGIDFIRAFAEGVYGVPPEQVVGSSLKTRFEADEIVVDLVKLGEINSFDDREVKAQNINLHIGRRPILAFGNSDGDLAMMRYTKAGRGRRLALLLHHDDSEREIAYDREFRLSPLAEALDKADEYGFVVVSMKSDWRQVFEQNPPESIRGVA